MSKTKDPNLKEERCPVTDGKSIAYYEAFLNAWVQNRMEVDKQILMLSSLAIGYVALFYDDIKAPSEFILWLLSGLAFLTSIMLALFIFKTNSDYISYILEENDGLEKKIIAKRLAFMTKLSFVAFFFGIVSTFALTFIKSNYTIIIKATGT